LDLLENGTPAEDTLRAAYIYHEALAALHQVSHGVPVKGCIHWSLLDNYESSLSYNNKCGLYCARRRLRRQRPRGKSPQQKVGERKMRRRCPFVFSLLVIVAIAPTRLSSAQER
jgi:beta-glucosidase/6-phospho-beta-glucosidase/beta-galactosidase